MASDPAIVAADVRNRLGATSTEVTDAQATQFIAFADGWADKVLALNSKTAGALETYETAIFKQAKIDVAAQMALTSIIKNSDEFNVGPIKVKSLDEDAIDKLYEELQAEIKKSLALLGWKRYAISTIGTGGDQYTPDLEDNTMIDYGEVDADSPFRTLT